ncbi:hypothetical protein KKA15_01780 [Patescibacteria group bacterium]|nr:hypothetical protein [Patescibacteria group bacterium]
MSDSQNPILFSNEVRKGMCKWFGQHFEIIDDVIFDRKALVTYTDFEILWELHMAGVNIPKLILELGSLQKEVIQNE